VEGYNSLAKQAILNLKVGVQATNGPPVPWIVAHLHAVQHTSC